MEEDFLAILLLIGVVAVLFIAGKRHRSLRKAVSAPPPHPIPDPEAEAAVAASTSPGVAFLKKPVLMPVPSQTPDPGMVVS